MSHLDTELGVQFSNNIFQDHLIKYTTVEAALTSFRIELKYTNCRNLKDVMVNFNGAIFVTAAESRMSWSMFTEPFLIYFYIPFHHQIVLL